MMGRKTTSLSDFIYFKPIVYVLSILLHWNISPMGVGGFVLFTAISPASRIMPGTQ